METSSDELFISDHWQTICEYIYSDNIQLFELIPRIYIWSDESLCIFIREIMFHQAINISIKLINEMNTGIDSVLQIDVLSDFASYVIDNTSDNDILCSYFMMQYADLHTIITKLIEIKLDTTEIYKFLLGIIQNKHDTYIDLHVNTPVNVNDLCDIVNTVYGPYKYIFDDRIMTSDYIIITLDILYNINSIQVIYDNRLTLAMLNIYLKTKYIFSDLHMFAELLIDDEYNNTKKTLEIFTHSVYLYPDNFDAIDNILNIVNWSIDYLREIINESIDHSHNLFNKYITYVENDTNYIVSLLLSSRCSFLLNYFNGKKLIIHNFEDFVIYYNNFRQKYKLRNSIYHDMSIWYIIDISCLDVTWLSDILINNINCKETKFNPVIHYIIDHIGSVFIEKLFSKYINGKSYDNILIYLLDNYPEYNDLLMINYLKMPYISPALMKWMYNANNNFITPDFIEMLYKYKNIDALYMLDELLDTSIYAKQIYEKR